MEDICVACCASSGEGALIREFTGGDVNHAAFIFLDPIFGEYLVLGANANGLTICALESFGDQIVHTFRARQGSLAVGLQKNARWLDCKYDYAGLLGMAAVEAARAIANWRIKNPFLSERELFCSEFATMVIRDSGYAILDGVTAGSIDPNELCKALLGLPESFEHCAGFAAP